MIDDFENYLLNLKNKTRHNDFCVNHALSHLNSIKEALDARENNPRQFYNDEIENAKFIHKAMPLLFLIQESGALHKPQACPLPGEN